MLPTHIMRTEHEQRDLRRRAALETEYEILSSSIVEVECAEVSEETFKAVERLIDKRKAEIESELIYLPTEND